MLSELLAQDQRLGVCSDQLAGSGGWASAVTMAGLPTETAADGDEKREEAEDQQEPALDTPGG